MGVLKPKDKLMMLRVANNLSRFEVSLKIGTSEDCIARIEKGQQKILFVEHAAKLAPLYKVSLDELLLVCQ